MKACLIRAAPNADLEHLERLHALQKDTEMDKRRSSHIQQRHAANPDGPSIRLRDTAKNVQNPDLPTRVLDEWPDPIPANDIERRLLQDVYRRPDDDDGAGPKK